MESWFAKRRKSKVLEIAYRQMTLSIDTVRELEKSVNAALNGNKKEALSSFERLSVVEQEIDELRRTVFEELTRGSLPFKDREDIMHLVKRLDVMADHVKDSGRSVVVLLEAKVMKEIWEQFVEIAKDLVVCSTSLRKALDKLGTNLPEARELSKKVDEIEHMVDEKYLKTKGILLKYADRMDSATLMLLSDLLESMENVADSCCDTSDYVRILTVARETA